ncbi:HIT family protein [Curtobacterium citreum]|uniref:HIT family protein n=1 Tax=Curtobacterium citreum TaxID=2036 RepID=UPI002542D8EA|nr:HIT domain-containing protein [Curtobacterium citreum]WIJ46737.1 HIT domain-containing protein [Curtobacterium citreum]
MNSSGSSLDIPKQEPCAFCDYLNGVRPFTVLYRDNVVAVLVTREQRGIGHLLVLPVRHYPTLLESEPDERHAIIDTLTWAAAAIDAAFERPGIAVWQNNGRAAHQAIPHLHFHIAGTLSEGGTDFGDVPELDLEQTDRIGQQILAALRHAPNVGQTPR